MTRFVVTETADADRDDITDDLAGKAGIVTASKFDDLFEQLYDRIERYPRSCPLRPGLGRNMRIGVVEPYIILYRYTEIDDTVTVLRLVDGRRKISKTLLSGRH